MKNFAIKGQHSDSDWIQIILINLNRLKAKSKISKLTLIEMLFTDDAAICATTEELHTIINTFDETFSEFGLKLAIIKNIKKKTEIMVQRNPQDKEKPEPKIMAQGKP